MNKRVFAGASALSIALPGLIATMALMPAANAIESDDETTSAGDSISSSATMEEQCKWVLIGAPSSVALTPTTAGEEYNGTDMELSASLSSISIHNTGNQDGNPSYASYTECTFFESKFKPTATLAIDATKFAASISGGDADTEMDFDAKAGNPLAFAFTKASECSTWATAAETLDLATTSAGTLLDLAIGDVTTPVTSAGENDKCQLTSGSVSINIPAGLNPTSPGSAYTFAGPTLTTALSTATS